jgi:hypothetical protein
MIRAIAGLDTYRYQGRYGFIYIGATSTAQARNEAARSTRDEIKLDKLELFNGTSWEKAK